MTKPVECLRSEHFTARGLTFVSRLLACLVLAVWLAYGGDAYADHTADHQASSAAPRSSAGALELLQQLTGGGSNEFLPPDVAYVMSVEAQDASTLLVRFDIADAYYLYREKFEFSVSGTPGTVIAATHLPEGKIKEDPYFGQMEVYYGNVEALISIERPESDTVPLNLEVGYQGCADAGLCYPPMTKSVDVTLPAPPTVVEQPAASAADIPAGNLPDQDRIARSLASDSTTLVLMSFFGFGLLLAFTPCVLPMIPILSSIIVGQGKGITTRRAFLLSLVYVLAMAAAYTLAGVVAGLAGSNLQAAFQSPWVLGVFAGLFVALALSMFGLFDLQAPARMRMSLTRLSNRLQGGTYIGVGIMGVLSALIVGPCVAAPLAGALIYISQSGDAVLGGTALFALSMGMGAPLIVAGTSGGKLLPRVGPWMAKVNVLFGVMLLGVAVYLLERILPEGVSMFLWGALLIGTAVYFGALDSIHPRAGGWFRLGRAAALVVGIYGVLILIGAAAGGNDVFRPLSSLDFMAGEEGKQRELVFKQIKGLEGLETELRLAGAAGTPVMLDFYADWCVSCKELERYTFSDPGVQAILANVVLLQSDVTANDLEDQALLNTLGLFGPPAILFFGPDGRERRQFRVVGFMDALEFGGHASKAIGGYGISEPVRELADDPSNQDRS